MFLKLQKSLSEIETRLNEYEADHRSLLQIFELSFNSSLLEMDENDIFKMLQKKKENSLKTKIDENLNRKWQLKQDLKKMERDIKVTLILLKLSHAMDRLCN